MQFITPISGVFTYVGWNIDLRLTGPFIRPSQARQEFIQRLFIVVRELEALPRVHRVRILESVFVPPLPGAPHLDVILLADSEHGLSEDLSALLAQWRLPPPEVVTVATNVARFGDTDACQGPVLLNHFAGSANPETAVATWREISSWYERILNVSNSTLLKFASGGRYLVVNYAVIPGTVSRFMLGQMLRISFYTQVVRRLRHARMTPFPIFARRASPN